MSGYDNIEGYMPLLTLFICVSAMLKPRRWPDEVNFGMAFVLQVNNQLT